jgi:hypothetical protein
MSQRKATEQQHVNLAKKQSLVPDSSQFSLSHAVIQRALANPRTLAPSEILQFQRSAGNQAVQRMLSGQLQRNLQAGFEAGNDFERQLGRTKGGSPLPRKTQAEFESSFGANFSNVRIHKDAAQTNSVAASRPKPLPTAMTSTLVQGNTTLLLPKASSCWPMS